MPAVMPTSGLRPSHERPSQVGEGKVELRSERAKQDYRNP